MHAAHFVTPTRHDYTDRGRHDLILSSAESKALLLRVMRQESAGLLTTEEALWERLDIYRRMIPTEAVMFHMKKAHSRLDRIDHERSMPLSA